MDTGEGETDWGRDVPSFDLSLVGGLLRSYQESTGSGYTSPQTLKVHSRQLHEHVSLDAVNEFSIL